MTGVVLLNLGTPRSPEPKDVGQYLKQFLMDPFVVDIPWLFRWLLVHGIILRTRPEASAKLYKSVWTQRGSPLLFHSLDLTEKVREKLSGRVQVELAMRYGNPSIPSVLAKMKNCDEVLVVPLYPQYSYAATKASIVECEAQAKKLNLKAKLKFAPEFYDTPEFISAFTKIISESLEREKPDHILFSYHGIPERQIKRVVGTSGACLNQATCCDTINEQNKKCYRAQCFETTRLLAKSLGLSPNQYTVGFQSRLGRTKWITPYSDVLYKELAERGVKKLLVTSPSFVADCLETLEEISIRGRESFKNFGGEDLVLVPSLNSSEPWVNAVSKMVLEFTSVR